MSREIYVALSGSDDATGAAESPLRTINRAAQLAHPGDTVTVRAGEYREWVRPARGGIDAQRRITYQAEPGARVVIKGSERVVGWTRDEGSVWIVRIPNSLFGDFNPFATPLRGDWLEEPTLSQPNKHLGDVYLNGQSFFEVDSRDAVVSPVRRTQQVDHWTGTTVRVAAPQHTTYVWYAEVDERTTTIWANFHGADPNAELVEVNVRPSVFSPTLHNLNYITVRGFELAQAATQWAPPTADQPGLVGPNWAKGWIIEDNVIHDSKCSGISLGKESSTGRNFAAERRNKPGYQYQLETVFAARKIGWDKELVGSHVVRRNTIFDCGQTGIVGHLGCVFSTIEDNHIYRIGLKREFFGHEIAGIKLHAAIDTELIHNRIHDCTLGIWLDWQTQGTRVSRNILYGNNRDLFIEVSHGPYVVDHNILGSPASLEVVCQGGAYVNNLVCGSVRLEAVLDRSTPYHLPHSTQIAGVAVVSGGDDRWIGNIFLGRDLDNAYAPGGFHHETSGFGTSGYSGYPASFDEYVAGIDRSLPDHTQFLDVRQPVFARQNVYLGQASPVESEHEPRVVDGSASVRIVDAGECVELHLDVPAQALDPLLGMVTGADLPPTRMSDAAFEGIDGQLIELDVDLVGEVKVRTVKYPAGPLASLPEGPQGSVRIW